MDATAREHNRWIALAGVPTVLAAGFVAAALATGIAWLYVPAVFLPGVLLAALFYLAMTSELNGARAHVVALPAPARADRKAA